MAATSLIGRQCVVGVFLAAMRQSYQFPLAAHGFAALHTKIRPLRVAPMTGLAAVVAQAPQYAFYHRRGEANKRGNTQKLRRYLLHHQTTLPILYTNDRNIQPSAVTLEHVVPVSIMAETPNPLASQDPANILLSWGKINNARGNMRFSFDLAHMSANTLVASHPNHTITHIGHCNCIDQNTRRFYPRSADIPIIARTVLGMQRKWIFPLDHVVTCTARELVELADGGRQTWPEVYHRLLCTAVEDGVVFL